MSETFNRLFIDKIEITHDDPPACVGVDYMKFFLRENMKFKTKEEKMAEDKEKTPQQMVEHAFTVNTLIKKLEELKEQGHGDCPIILSKDAEGNDFSPFPAENAVSWDSLYRAECTWSGEVRDVDDFEDDEEKTDYEKASVKSVVFWPTN
jgi:hypothetical protein